MAQKMTLLALRKNANLSQAEAAQKLGVCLSTLQNYEHGVCYPTVPIIDRIEEVYGVRYSDINFYPRITV